MFSFSPAYTSHMHTYITLRDASTHITPHHANDDRMFVCFLSLAACAYSHLSRCKVLITKQGFLPFQTNLQFAYINVQKCVGGAASP